MTAVAVAALLAVTGCIPQVLQTSTPLPPTATSQPASPRPSATPTATPPTDTATPQPPTATPRTPTASPTPRPETPTAVPASPTSTLPPATPTPSPTSPSSGPIIHIFRANVEVADPGDTVTLSWEWSGGEQATVHHLLPTGQLGSDYWDVGPTGSLQYTISPLRRNFDTFALFVYKEGQASARATVEVQLRCLDEWFFSPAPDICPFEAPLISDGAEQHFEHGVMLWMGAEDLIYVLFDDAHYPKWSAYEDHWDEGEPTMDPSIEPPPGRQQPVRGFGLVWREQPTVWERLGWAIDAEKGYQTALQRTSHYRYPLLYIRALDGGVWELEPNGSAWAHLYPSQ